MPTTEARLAELKAESAAYTELNIQRDELAAAELREEEERIRQEREERARELLQQDLAEKREKDRNNADIIDSLERTKGNAAKIIAKTRATATKRAATSHKPTTFQPSSMSAKQLRERNMAGAVDTPHVPFTDNLYCYEDKFQLRDSYLDPLSEWARDNQGLMRAGGFRHEDAWERAIRFAVAGLDLAPLEDSTDNPMEVDTTLPANSNPSVATPV
jgi:CDK-activating kinase assembly factor MAT1